MNRLQKKIITIALALSNIVLTSVVACTATFAWFKAVGASVDSVPTEKDLQIGSDAGLSLSYEVLAYDDDAKEGVSYQGNANAFKLRDYDRYISYNHKYENAIIRAKTTFSSFTADKEINIDITCEQPYFNGNLVTDYTSNVIQFKTSVITYTRSDSLTPVHLNEYIIDEVDEQGRLASAARSYETAVTYFRTVDVADSFVSAYKDTANKLHYTLTCVPYLPTDTLGSDHTITSAIIYIECSYNEEAVQYYINHNSNPGTKLTGDITKIQFKNVPSVSGGYEKVTSTPAGGWDGDYLAVYENNTNQAGTDGTGLAYDGLATAAQVNEKGNFFKVGFKGNAISANSVLAQRDINIASMENSQYSLQTQAANYIGHGTDTAITARDTKIPNTISSDGLISSTTATTRSLAFYDNTNSEKFGYLTNAGTGANKKPALYRYNGSYVAPVLTSIVANPSKTNYTVGESINKNTDLTVTAFYQNGSEKDVTSSCELSGYDMSMSGTQTVHVYYQENNVMVHDSYQITISSTPYLELSDYEITISGTGVAETITVTPHNFAGEVLYEWTSLNPGAVAVTSGSESATVTVTSVSQGHAVINCYATDGEHEVNASCTVYVVTSGSIWKLVENESDLHVNDKVVIAAAQGDGTYVDDYAISTNQRENNRSAASISKNDDEKTISFSDSAGVAVFDVRVGTESNTFAFYDDSNGGYIYAQSSSSNNMRTQATNDANGSFSVSIDSEGAATLVAQGSNTRNTIRYNNGSSSNLLFSCYASGQKGVSLYKLESGNPLVGLTYSGTPVNQYSGREFDATGLTVYALYRTGDPVDVTSQVTWNNGDPLTMGTTLVPVSFTEDGVTKVTYVVDINVIQTVLQSLEITGTPTTTVYLSGSHFNKAGLTVKAIYNFSAQGVDVTNLPGLKWYAKGTQSETLPVGTTKVTASYTDGDGLSASADLSTTITVVNKELSSISVSGGKTSYVVGETFSFNSTVTAHYNSSYPGLVPDETVSSGYTLSGVTNGHVFNSDDVVHSPLTCTVTYQGKTASIQIEVETLPVYGEYSGTITEGDYLIVGDTTDVAMSNTVSTSLTASNVTISNRTISNPSSSLVWHFSQNSGSTWSFYNNDVGKYASNSSSYYTTLSNTCDSSNEKFTIASSVSAGKTLYTLNVNSNRYLHYYSSGSRFDSDTSSTAYYVRLFKKGYTPSTITKVTISNTILTLKLGGTPSTGQLSASVTGTGSYSTAVTWSSSDTSKATVDSTGLVTAIGGGEVTITVASVQDPTKTATCTVTVETKSIVSIASSPGSVEAGASGTITASVTTGWDGKTKSNISWSILEGSDVIQTSGPDSSDNGKYNFTAKSSVASNTNVVFKADLGNGSTATATVTIKKSGGPSVYTRVSSASDITAGTYLIVYENENMAFNGSLTTLDAVNNYSTVTISNGTIAISASTEAIEFTISGSSGSWNIKSKSGYYIGNTSNSNALSASKTTTYTNSITVNGTTVDIISSGGAYLRFNTNSGQDRFRYFKSSTYTSQKAITLYKKS